MTGAVLLAAFVAVVLIAWLRTEPASQQGGSVEFGLPLHWVSQHSTLDPPAAERYSMQSPQEAATDVHWAPLLLDVGVAAGLMTISGRGARLLRRG